MRSWLEEMGRWWPGNDSEVPFDCCNARMRLGRTLSVGRASYCHECAAQIGYQLWPVDYSGSTVCPLHLVQLQHGCPSCGEDLSPATVLKARCPCGQDLRENFKAIKVSADQAVWELGLGQYLSDDRFRAQVELNRRHLPSWLRALDLEAINSLFIDLHRILVPGAPGMSLADEARQALMDWPRAFHARLRHLVERPQWRGGHTQRPVLAMAIWSQLLSTCHGNVVPEVVRQIHRFMDERAFSSSREVNVLEDSTATSSPSSGISRLIRTDVDVGEELGWTCAEVRWFMREMGVQSVERLGGQNFIDWVIASELVDALSGYVPVRILARRFSLTPFLFCKLMQMAGVMPECRLLAPVRLGAKAVTGIETVSYEAWQEVRTALEKSCCLISGDGCVAQPLLTVISQKEPKRPRRFAVMTGFRRLLSGELPAYRFHDIHTIADIWVVADQWGEPEVCWTMSALAARRFYCSVEQNVLWPAADAMGERKRSTPSRREMERTCRHTN